MSSTWSGKGGLRGLDGARTAAEYDPARKQRGGARRPLLGSCYRCSLGARSHASGSAAMRSLSGLAA